MNNCVFSGKIVSKIESSLKNGILNAEFKIDDYREDVSIIAIGDIAQYLIDEFKEGESVIASCTHKSSKFYLDKIQKDD